MSLLNTVSVLLSLAAVLSYINYRFIKLPGTIGLMLITMLMSLGLVVSPHLGFGLESRALSFVNTLHFDETLMVGMLSFLLFAGALHVNLTDLMEKKWEVLIFATVGVVLSTGIVGVLTYLVSIWTGLGLPFIYCMLFGALISPTDPIAVLGILKDAGTSKSLQTKITGESLFNDGIGIVVFITILDIATGGHEVSAAGVAGLFVVEAVGGAAFGLALGYAAYRMLRSVDNYKIEVLVTLALVSGGYALALSLHTSGPIAIVVAGLLIGNHGRQFAMSDRTRERLDDFWELVDEILNAVLFVMIGLELMVIKMNVFHLATGAIAVVVALMARFISIGIPVCIMRVGKRFSNGIVKIMTWGGLRGGISVALALSLPDGMEREIILTMTYIVVAFSILVQGLTLKYVVRH